MRGHAVVQAGAAGRKPFGLGVIGAGDQAHQFVHDVAVEPGRPEAVLGHHPAGREDHEVDVGCARRVRGRGQDGEDRGVRVVEAHRVDRVEASEVVFAGGVIAVPGDDVERGMVQRRRPEAALELLHQLGRPLDVLEGGDGRQEVPRIGQAVGADRPQLGQAQQGAIVLADIAARRAIGQLDPEAHPARDHRDLQGLQGQDTHLGDQPQPALLGDDQQLAVGVEEDPIGHRTVGEIEVGRQPRAFGRRSRAGQGDQALDEVLRRIGDRWRIPAQAVGRRLGLLEGARAEQVLRDPFERRMIGRRTDAVEPGTAVLGPGRGEGGSRQALGIEAQGRALGRVLADGQGAWNGFAGELVAVAREIGRLGLPGPGVGRGDHAVSHLKLPRHYGPAAPCGAIE